MYSAAQQAKIDAAQTRLNLAKTDWKAATDFWQEHFVGLKCYGDTKYDILQAVSWFTPTDTSCHQKGQECKNKDKQDCKKEIEVVRGNIGSIRSSHAELIAAQKNYDTVLNSVIEESANDPTVLAELAEIGASAAANKQRWIFWGIFVGTIGLLVFSWFKWGKKATG